MTALATLPRVHLEPGPKADRQADLSAAERIVNEGIRRHVRRYEARRKAIKTYLEYRWYRTECRKRPWTMCQRIFPTKGGDLLDGYTMRDLLKEVYQEQREEARHI